MPNGLPNKHGSLSKSIAASLGGFAVLIIIAVLCLPMFFSTTAGKKMLIKMISNRTGFQIQIEELSLSWFGSQMAEGIRARKVYRGSLDPNENNRPDDKEKVDFTAQQIETNSPLWKIIFLHDLGQMKMMSPDMKITNPFHLSPTGFIRKRSYQSASFAPKINLGMAKIQIPMKGKIDLEQGKMEFISPGMESISFDEIQLALNLMSNEEVDLALNCTTSQQGQIAIKAAISQLNAPFPNIFAQTNINQLPVRGIDQMASLFNPEFSGLLYDFLGPTINLGCHLTASAGNFDLRLNAASPQINAYIATKSLNGILSLKSPAEFNFKFTPSLLQKAAKLYPVLQSFSLENPFVLQTTIEQFTCPVPRNTRDLLQSSFQATLAAMPQISLTVNERPLSINNFNVVVDSLGLDKHVSSNLGAGLQTNGQSGSIGLQSSINAPFDKAMNGNISFDAKQFPVGLIGSFVSSSSSLIDLLGPSADFNAALVFKGPDRNLHLTWESLFLKIPTADFSLNSSFILTSPCHFSLMLNPTFFKDHFPKGFQLVNSSPIEGTLQKISIPLQNFQSALFDATLMAEQMTFAGTFPLNVLKIETTIAMNTFDHIALRINSDPIKLALAGSYHPASSSFTLTSPFSLQCDLNQQMAKNFFPQAPELLKPTHLQLSINPLTIPLKEFSPLGLKLSGQISDEELLLMAQGKQIALQNVSVPFQWDGVEKLATVQLSSQIQNPSDGSGSIQGQFNLSHFSTDNGLNIAMADLQASLDAQNLSTALLNAFLKKNISAIAGPVFNSNLKLQSTVEKQMLGVKWASQNLQIDTEFVVDERLHLQGSNNQVVMTLTPEGYQALDKILANQTSGLIPFEIKDPSTLTINLSKLSLPVTREQKITSFQSRFPEIQFDLFNLQMSISGRDPNLIIFDKISHDTIQLQNLTFSLNKNQQSPLAVSLDTTVKAQESHAGSVRNGSLSLNGKLQQTLNEQGKLDLSQLTASLHFKALQLPSRALDFFARIKGRTDMPFSKMFGHVINASFNTDLNQFTGPITLNLNTPLAKAELNGTFKNGTLLLKDAIQAQIKITPESSRLFLKEVNPLNLSYLYSQDPVTMEIPSAGFSFPVYPFNLSKIIIPKATIELGKIACRNEGNVNIALQLLKTKQFENSNELMLWFAPLDFSIKQGFTEIERTEILLADTFDVCLWGSIDMPEDYIDMVLGLTAQTLNKAFGIKNLPENYVLRIQMKGKADNVQIDSGKATAKIALLLAWQQATIAGAIGEGPVGALVGALAKRMATLPDANEKAPPAKRPFPWETEKPRPTRSNEKKKQFKPTDKPLKQILKLIK